MAAKPDVLELLGVAVNASSLVLDERQERPLDRIAALGAAAAEIAAGADLKRLPLAAVQLDVYRASASMADLMLDPGTPDERDQLAAELGQLACHMRFGGQVELAKRAIPLFARWLKTRRLFADVDSARSLLLFAARVLDEWLSDKCLRCGGSGKLERSGSGSWIRPRGTGQRNATFRPCNACDGCGRAAISHTARATWLEISREDYEAARWPQRFNAATTWLELLIVGRVKRALTLQLERRTKRV
jgi:hypothetical protein